MTPLTAGPVLVYRIVSDLMLSGLRVARQALRRTPPADGFVRMRYGRMSPAGAAILGWCVALAPGSTVIENNVERQELLLHLLDVDRAGATIAEIRREFEAPLLQLFGTPPA